MVVAEYYSPSASALERAPDLALGTADTRDDTAWLTLGSVWICQQSDPDTPLYTLEHMQQFGVQSLLSIPLTAKGQTFGYASLWETRQPRVFTSEEIQLCLGIAQQAAIAFDNARLFDTSRQQLALSRVLQAVSALLTVEMSLAEVFERIFDLLSEVIQYDCVSIELFDAAGSVYLAAQRGYPDPELAREFTRHVSGPSLRQRWGNTSVIVIPDTQHDPRWLALPEFEFIHARIMAWLRVKNCSFGVLNVDRKMARPIRRPLVKPSRPLPIKPPLPSRTHSWRRPYASMPPSWNSTSPRGRQNWRNSNSVRRPFWMRPATALFSPMCTA